VRRIGAGPFINGIFVDLKFPEEYSYFSHKFLTVRMQCYRKLLCREQQGIDVDFLTTSCFSFKFTNLLNLGEMGDSKENEATDR
jgi:hypothetical protein